MGTRGLVKRPVKIDQEGGGAGVVELSEGERAPLARARAPVPSHMPVPVRGAPPQAASPGRACCLRLSPLPCATLRLCRAPPLQSAPWLRLRPVPVVASRPCAGVVAAAACHRSTCHNPQSKKLEILSRLDHRCRGKGGLSSPACSRFYY